MPVARSERVGPALGAQASTIVFIENDRRSPNWANSAGVWQWPKWGHEEPIPASPDGRPRWGRRGPVAKVDIGCTAAVADRRNRVAAAL
jgi:hypothetical protein